MKLSSAIQEALLSLLCFDADPGGGRAVAGLLEPGQYDPYYKDIAKDTCEYISKYSRVPGEHTLDIIDTLCVRHSDREEIYRRIYSSIYDIQDELNRDYVLGQAHAFSRHQSLKVALGEAIEVLQQGTAESVTEAEGVLGVALKANFISFDAGTFITDTQRALRFLEHQQQEIHCGIEALDRLGLGPARKQLHILGGLPGSGKSWWLINLAKFALLQRLSVLYITLELSEQYVMQRVMQSLFSVSKRDESVSVQKFSSDKWGHFEDMQTELIEDRPYLTHGNIRNLLVEKIGGLVRRKPFLVKEFPTGCLTVRQLESFMDSLQGSENFMPDIVLVDYPDLMTTDAANLRNSLGGIYKDLRGVAVKRNIAMAVVTQLNRSAAQTTKADKSSVAEDFSKVATGDVFITLNQTEAEEELGLARLYVDKGRTDKDKFTVLIAQAYALGQFCMSSVLMGQSYWDNIKADKPDDEDEDSNEWAT